MRVDVRIDRDPALPQPLTFLSRCEAGAHRSRRLMSQANYCVRVRLEIEPPRGMALVEAVHRERHEGGAVFEIADDDIAFLP